MFFRVSIPSSKGPTQRAHQQHIPCQSCNSSGCPSALGPSAARHVLYCPWLLSFPHHPLGMQEILVTLPELICLGIKSRSVNHAMTDTLVTNICRPYFWVRMVHASGQCSDRDIIGVSKVRLIEALVGGSRRRWGSIGCAYQGEQYAE